MYKRNNDFDFDFKSIGQAIKAARKAQGMTREQLAVSLIMTPDTFKPLKTKGSIRVWSCSFSSSRCLACRWTNTYIRAKKRRKAPSAGVWTLPLTD